MVLFSDTPPVGLLLTDDFVYAVEIAPGRGDEYRILHADRVPTPRGAYSGGVVKNAELLAQTLRELWGKSGINGKRVVLGLSAPYCSWRRMDIPPGPRTEQLLMVRNELAPEGVYDPDQHLLDFVSLALPPGEDGVPVIVAIVEQARLNALREVLFIAGLSLEAVEPLTVSAVRLAAAAVGREATSTVVLVSSGSADLMIAQGGSIRLQRRISGEWRAPHTSRPTYLGDDTEDEEVVSLDQSAQVLLGEVRRSAAFCQRLAPNLPAPEKVLLISEESDLDTFLAATANIGSPNICAMLETLLQPQIPIEVRDSLAGGDGTGCLLALGLALRRIPAYSEGNRLDVSQSTEKVHVSRSSAEIRQKTLVLAGTVAAVNAVLWFTLGDAVRRLNHNAQLWGSLASTVSLRDPNLRQRDRVQHAQKEASIGDVRPDLWLELLGGVASPEVQVSSVHLTQQQVSLQALVSRTGAVLPFSRSLERYLPLQDSPTVSVTGGADGNAAFTLNARLRGPLSAGQDDSAPGKSARTESIAQKTAEAGEVQHADRG